MNTTCSHWPSTAAITLLLAAALPLPGLAAAAPTGQGGSVAGTETGGKLEEIIVTAQKRVESLEKVPMSITAIDEHTLDVQGVKGIDDIARLVPGLHLQIGRAHV